jgi:thioredoxin-related protein
MKTILFYLLFIVSCNFSAQITPLKIGEVAPLQDHKMSANQSQIMTLKDAMGENGLIVIFSSNSCPFVVGFDDKSFAGWENQYNPIYDKAQLAKTNVILINSNEAKRSNGESLNDMIERKAMKGFKMPYLMDSNSELANAFGGKTTPHVFYFDKSFKLIYTGSIDNSFEEKRKKDVPYLINAIEAHSIGKKIKPNSTSPKGCSIKRIKN